MSAATLTGLHPHAARPHRPWWASLNTVVRRVHEFLCGLRGHEALLHIEPDRLYLECAHCGFRSAGWQVTPARPRLHRRARRAA